MLSKVRKVVKIGKGSSGTVWEATLHHGKHSYPLALKEVPLPEEEEKQAMVVREMRMLLATAHSCIVECYGVFFMRGTFHMVMELVNGGSLLDLMKVAPDRIPQDAVAAVALALLSALSYLHDEVLVVHRDVKPGNILLSLDGDVKLADLGICTRPRESPSQTWVGTVTYMSPERIVGDEYSYASDVWSAGLVVLEAVMGMYPFMHVAPKTEGNLEFWDLLDILVSGPTPSEILASAGIDADACMIDLVDKCMHKDDLQRPTASECLELPFLADKAHPERELQRKMVLATWVRSANTCLVASSNAKTGHAVCGTRMCLGQSGQQQASQPLPQQQHQHQHLHNQQAQAQQNEGSTSALQDFVKSLGVGSDKMMNLFKL
jgi:mitogen-activated protein kinase kinase 1